MTRPPLKRRGDVVVHWRIEVLLGAGQEGDVYLVTDLRDGAKRSLKLLRGRNALEEARCAAAFYRRLTKIGSVKRFCSWGVLPSQVAVGLRPYLLFEYVPGETLERHVARARSIPPLNLIRAVCDALVPIHAKGLAIGDFDGGRNILIERRTRRLVFCDLDYGVPGRPNTAVSEDIAELQKLARMVYRRAGMRPSQSVLDVLAQAGSVAAAELLLSRLPSGACQQNLTTAPP